MKFEDLVKANDMIKTTDIGKGKDYAEVNQRVKAFRFLYPEGRILTEMISNVDGVCIFKATAYDVQGNALATGTAYEKEGSSFINKTSYIENCETSAVGRALAFLGIGIDVSIASKEEVENAKAQQAVEKPEVKPAMINETQKVELLKEMKRTGMAMESLLGWAKVDSVDKLSTAQYEKTMKQLKIYPNKEDNKTLNDIQKSDSKN